MTVSNRQHTRKHSLKSKIVISVTLLFILFSAIIGYVGKWYFEQKIKEAIFSEQYSLVTVLANNIDDKLLLIHQSLIDEAKQTAAAVTSNPAKAQEYLDSRIALKSLFNNALFLFSKEGKIIAESPFIEGRRGRDISFREYFRITMKTGKPHISAPYLSTHNPDHPAVILTAPVRDNSGNIIALLAGSFDLFGSNILGELTATRVGNTGYVYLFSSDRTMIMHPDRTRIMKKDVKPGANPLFDRAIEGFEGSGETINSRGLQVLASFKRLKSTGWILAANYPVSEAYTSLREARNFLVIVLAVGTILMILMICLLMRRYMTSLETMISYVGSLPQHISTRTPLSITSNDEIETLANAFNTMLDEVAKHQQTLKESEKNFRMLIEHQNDLVVKTDQHGNFMFVSPSLCQFIGKTETELIGKPFTDLIIQDDRELVRLARKELYIPPYICSYEHRITVNGETCWLAWSEKALPSADGLGDVVAVGRDVTRRKTAEEEISKLAYYDALTNLPNRALLHDRLNQAIAQAARDNRHVGLIFLDLDHFKNINDTMGHSIGDMLLCTIAQRLEQSIRKTDTLARLGGDEFVIAVTAINNAEDISHIAGTILTRLAVPLTLSGIDLYTSASIGIAIFPEDGNDVDTLLKNADLAMYKAKSNGRNNFQFFSHDMNEKATERLMLENYLRKAIEREELFLVYQPQVNMQTGKLVGVESLIRWQHPVLGLISPDRFIPLAEETGLINSIGQWVLRNACQQAMNWRAAGLPTVRVAVNISARQFAQHDFLSNVREIIAETGLPTEWLEIELTESAIMTDIKRTTNTLHELKSSGISISVDDFGTGYSSLGNLKLFPLDRLKIDRSFVNRVHEDPNDGAIAEAIIRMSHSLGLNVVAEGIEHNEQLMFLAERGCNEMQGFLVSRPLSVEAAGRFMEECRVIE